MPPAEKFAQLTCTRAVRADLPARSVRATVFTALSGFGDFAIRLGSTAILARLIVPEHFGLVMMVTAITGIADQLRELGLSSATIQQPKITHEEVTNLFWVNIAVSSLLALVVCACSPALAAYYQEPRLTPIACILASTLVLGGLTVQHQALLTRQLRLRHTATIRLLSSLLSTALAIGLALFDFGYWALLWREIARSALLAVGMWLCFPWAPGLPFRNTSIRHMLSFGANLTGANILASITASVDRLLIGRFCGAGPVGMYRQASQLIAAPTDQLLSPLYQVAHPSLSLLQTEPQRYARFCTKMLTVVCMITMPLSLFVAVYATEITLVLLGEPWIAAAPVLFILSLGTFIKQAIGASAFVSITRGLAGTHLRLTAAHNFTFIALACIGVQWGVEGVAFADVAATYLLLAPRLHFSLKGSPVSVSQYLGTLLRPAGASFAMGGVLMLIQTRVPMESPVVALLVAAPLAALSFVFAWLLLPGGFGELNALKNDLQLALRRRAPASPLLQPVASTQ